MYFICLLKANLILIFYCKTGFIMTSSDAEIINLNIGGKRLDNYLNNFAYVYF